MNAFLCERLIDGTGKPPLENVVLLEENGLIKTVARAADISIPDHATIIRTQTLMPGLIDTHVHLAYTGKPEKGAFRSEASETSYPLLALRAAKHAKDTLEWGFTSVRDMNAPGGVIIDLRDAINAGHVQGSRVKACGLGLSVTGGHMDAGGWGDHVRFTDMTLPCDGALGFIRGARSQVKRGADFIKINLCVGSRVNVEHTPYRQEMTDEEIAAVMQEAAHLEKFVAAHTSGGSSVKKAVALGLNTVEHGHWIDEETADLMAERGAYYVPTLLVNERNFDFPLEHLSAATRLWLEKSREDKWVSLEIVHKAGVKIALGTDAGFTLPHGSMNARELELLMHGGLTALEAIKAGTQTAAELMQMPNLGSIKTGKIADLLLVDGNPLEDIKVLQDKNNLRVFKDGLEVQA